MKTIDKKLRYIWRSFQEAREFVRGLKLKGSIEWCKWAQTNTRPTYIPVAPDIAYKDKG